MPRSLFAHMRQRCLCQFEGSFEFRIRAANELIPGKLTERLEFSLRWDTVHHDVEMTFQLVGTLYQRLDLIGIMGICLPEMYLGPGLPRLFCHGFSRGHILKIAEGYRR